MQMQQPTVYGGAGKFHYTAVLTNSNSGDVSESEARYEDRQAIPLINDTTGYSVALSKLTIQGSSANLPLLIPPLRALSTAGEDFIKTNYCISVRYRVEQGAAATRTLSTPHAWSAPIVKYIDIPSIYPDESRADVNGKFYWVTSVYDVVDAINAAIADAFAGGNIGEATGGSLVFTANAAGIFSGGGGTATTANVSNLTEFVAANGFTLQDGRAPIALTYDPQLKWCSFLTDERAAADIDVPGYAIAPGSNAVFQNNTFLSAYVYFNDKLLEAMPFDWVVDMNTPTGVLTTRLQSMNPDRVRDPAFNSAVAETGSGFMYPLALTSTHAQALAPALASVPAQAYSFGRNSAVTTATFVVPQENPAFDNWRPYTGFAIRSDTIHAYPTAIGQNVVDRSGSFVPAVGTKLNGVLFEADMPLKGGLYTVQDGLEYDPNILQWKSLKSGSNLSIVDFKLYLRTRSGDYVPWRVTNGGTITAQLVFALQPW